MWNCLCPVMTNHKSVLINYNSVTKAVMLMLKKAHWFWWFRQTHHDPVTGSLVTPFILEESLNHSELSSSCLENRNRSTWDCFCDMDVQLIQSCTQQYFLNNSGAPGTPRPLRYINGKKKKNPCPHGACNFRKRS